MFKKKIYLKLYIIRFKNLNSQISINIKLFYYILILNIFF